MDKCESCKIASALAGDIDPKCDRGEMAWCTYQELTAEIGNLHRQCADLEKYKQGYERYEKLRLLRPDDFASLCARNLHGENFDAMVDALGREPR